MSIKRGVIPGQRLMIKCWTIIQMELGVGNFGLFRSEENRSPQRKTSWSKDYNGYPPRLAFSYLRVATDNAKCMHLMCYKVEVEVGREPTTDSTHI